MSLLTSAPGKKWYFYACDELHCAFFYENSARTDPPDHADVNCIALRRTVAIRLVGNGREGYNAVCDAFGDDFLFPVDLYHKPFRVNPLPSQNMPNWRIGMWRHVIREFCKQNGLIDPYRGWRRLPK